ncbi:MAG: hypothetical protein Q7O66_08865 [Dehalococcoidia bacterium]|nr:hypothetical protein [Dehalococcoidia bacterium]
MNSIYSVRFIWQKRRLLAIVPVVIVLNLMFGAPLLCRLHCSVLAADRDSLDNMLLNHYHNNIDASVTVVNVGMPPMANDDAGEMDVALISPALANPADDLPRRNCVSEMPGSNHFMVSAFYEFASLTGRLPVQPLATTTLMATSHATPVSVYVSPLERPPAVSFDS